MLKNVGIYIIDTNDLFLFSEATEVCVVRSLIGRECVTEHTFHPHIVSNIYMCHIKYLYIYDLFGCFRKRELENTM